MLLPTNPSRKGAINAERKKPILKQQCAISLAKHLKTISLPISNVDTTTKWTC